MPPGAYADQLAITRPINTETFPKTDTFTCYSRAIAGISSVLRKVSALNRGRPRWLADRTGSGTGANCQALRNTPANFANYPAVIALTLKGRTASEASLRVLWRNDLHCCLNIVATRQLGTGVLNGSLPQIHLH